MFSLMTLSILRSILVFLHSDNCQGMRDNRLSVLLCCTLGEKHNSSVNYWQRNGDVKLQALFFHFNNTICCVFHLRELATVSELFTGSVKTAREVVMIFFPELNTICWCSLFLTESFFTCHYISIEEEMLPGGMVATVNDVLYNEVELSHLYAERFI